jgi:hypothetical protein
MQPPTLACDESFGNTVIVLQPASVDALVMQRMHGEFAGSPRKASQSAVVPGPCQQAL